MNKAKWFQGVVETHQEKLTTYTFHILKDVNEAREVVQEAFLKLWQTPDLTPLENSAHLWLYRVCRNSAIDRIRRSKSMSKQELVDDPTDKKTPVDLKLENLESAESVNTAMQGLPKKHQDLLRLKFEQDLSYKQIATVTGYSVTNVGFLLHDAIARIRKNLRQTKGGQSS